MPQKTRRSSLLAKIETVYGTDSVPTGAANAILISDLNVKPINQELVNRDLIRPYLGNSEQLPAAAWKSVDFSCEIAGSGAAGTAPKWGPLLRGCGMGETISVGVKVDYKPISSAEEALTLYCNYDGVLHKLLGARGTFGLTLNSRQRPIFRFSYMGLFVPVADDALPTVTLTGWQKPLPVNNTNTSAFALHAFAGKMSELSVDMNVRSDYRNLIGTEDIQLTDRNPTGSISMEATTVAEKDFVAIANAATLGNLAITHGTVAGNKFQITADNVQIVNPDYRDVNGIRFWQMGLSFIPGASGNDEITLTAL